MGIRKLKYTVLTKNTITFFSFVQNVDFYRSGDYNQLTKRDSEKEFDKQITRLIGQSACNVPGETGGKTCE